MVIEQNLSDAVLTLTLQRPQKRNAMSSELVATLLSILARIDADPDVGAVLLVGSAGGFCAGSDLSELAHMTPEAQAAFERDSGLLARRLIESSKPVVAAVHGFAIGGGLTLATSCDAVVTTRDARWSLPEVPIGLFPAWGLASVAARIGAARARWLSFGVDTWDGEAAVKTGLADVLAEDAAATARQLALQLARLPRAQAASVKRFFAQSAAFADADQRANDIFIQATQSREGAATLEAFRRKAREQKN